MALAIEAYVSVMANEYSDDQCSGANPRFPLIAELRQLLLDSYHGLVFQDRGPG